MSLYILTVKQVCRNDRLYYFNNRDDAMDFRAELTQAFFYKFLRTANKIKGAIRGQGAPKLHALAAGIAAEEYSIVITKEYLRGDTQ